MEELLYRQEVFDIQGAIFEVSRSMGTGFLEAVYQECLGREFGLRHIPFVQHRELKLKYKGEPLAQTYRPDFVCFESIIIELKVVPETGDIHRAQLINYLKATGIRLGLLVNFGDHPKARIERFVN